jgi:putative ABC transport system permease protein
MTLRKLHALSAVLIAAFACLHIVNHLVGLSGVAQHIAFMEVARSVYRFPAVEPALLSCVAFQIVSGLTFVVRGWKQRNGFVPWLQAISGAYLSFFLVIHVGAVLFGRGVLHLNTNFYFAAAGFHVAPFQFFFAPYYFFAVVALFTHLGCAAYWHSQSRTRLARTLVVALPLGVGAIASPLIVLSERIAAGSGKEKDISVMGAAPEYQRVRNLVVLSGRFFDGEDSTSRNKVGVLTQKMAEELYGSVDAAVGQVIKLNGLPFTVVGTFKEGVDTFGQSEVQDYTMVIPSTVSRYFTETAAVKQIFFTVASPDDVVSATSQIQHVIQARHRPESVYTVSNLTQLLSVWDKIANALTFGLLLIAAVTLLVSGIGIMNIMLATVSSRIREIGIRKAIGATNREIRFQFLAEAMLISLIGGIAGIVIGLAIPFSVRFLTAYRIPISGLSAIIAILVSSLVGIIFGTLPATRAAQLDPVESLRYE